MRCFGIFIISLILLLPLSLYSQTDKKDLVFVINVKQNIDKSSMRKVNMGIKEAIEKKADYIILDLNTYGGAVDAADSIRTALIQCPIPTIAFINPQAASAGALISIACDSIYMRSGSSIGAATVVDQNGKVMPDKYQSFMRGMMRSTAESHGKKPDGQWYRDPMIAQQMTDTTNVLTFTQEEAIANNYCEGKAESIEEVVEQLTISPEHEIVEQTLTFIDKIILFLLSPILQGIFLMMIVGGIYFELQSPGIGFPLAIAITGALLYFAPLYITGLALNWEIILFFVGIGLLAIEIFVTPGFGVAGVSGIILIMTSLIFAMIDNNLFYFDGKINFSLMVKPLAIVLLSSFTGLALSIWGVGKLYPKKSFSYIALKTELEGSEGWVGVETKTLALFVGKSVQAKTDFHPSGKIELDGKLYEAILEFGSAEKGDMLKITRYEGGRLYCEKSAIS
jgi:membrane-bound serine protease (ClpP class)